VASVARVATGAAPGTAGGAVGGAAASDGAAAAQRRPAGGRAARAEEGAAESAKGDGAAFGAYGGGAEPAPQDTAVARPQAAAAASPAEAIARLDRIEALRDGAAARPLSHVTLMVENATGGEDRIRVGLRGTAVGATLELSDPAAVDRLGATIGELQQALEQRGLETDALRVRRQAAVVPESIEMHRVAGLVLEREAARGGSSSTGQQPAPRERDGRSPTDERRQDSSSPHHRSRRDPKEGR
jgi:hypothetical protein